MNSLPLSNKVVSIHEKRLNRQTLIFLEFSFLNLLMSLDGETTPSPILVPSFATRKDHLS